MTPASSQRPDDEGRVGMALTEHEISALVAYAQRGSIAEVAGAIGKSLSTTKNLLARSYAKLGVYGAINAFRHLGWLRVPEELA